MSIPNYNESSEAGFRKLFDLNPLPMWLFDAKSLQFLAVNDAATRHYGYSREEFLSMTLFDVRPPEEVSRFRSYFEQANLQPEIVRYIGEWTHRKKGGELIQLEVTSHRFLFEGKEAVLSVMNDVTERKKSERLLRESEHRFRMLSEAAVEAIAIHQDMKIMEVNDSFLRLFGLTKVEEALGKSPLDFVPKERRDFVLQKIKENTVSFYELNLERSDGQVICVEVHARNIRYRDGVARVVALHDITGRKRHEEALREREARLAASNRDLEQFAYVTSHDLQEPLRMVASYVALLEKQFSPELNDRARDYIRFAVEGAKRMKQLIDDLLMFSRVGKKELAPRPVNLEEVLGVVLLDLRFLIEETGAVITHDPLPHVNGDALQLGQLLTNLITNGIKFRGGSSPKVHLSATLSLSGEWIIHVRDHGIGIDMQYADRIFRIFQRLHTVDEYPGTGIGLAICKKIVERHGGDIWVESSLGGGSTFSFALPNAAPAAPRTAANSLV